MPVFLLRRARYKPALEVEVPLFSYFSLPHPNTRGTDVFSPVSLHPRQPRSPRLFAPHFSAGLGLLKRDLFPKTLFSQAHGRCSRDLGSGPVARRCPPPPRRHSGRVTTAPQQGPGGNAQKRARRGRDPTNPARPASASAAHGTRRCHRPPFPPPHLPPAQPPRALPLSIARSAVAMGPRPRRYPWQRNSAPKHRAIGQRRRARPAHWPRRPSEGRD